MILKAILLVSLILIINILIVVIHIYKPLNEKLKSKESIINILPVVLFPFLIIIVGVINLEELELFCNFYFLPFFLFYSVLIIKHFSRKIFEGKMFVLNEVYDYFWILGMFITMTTGQIIIVLAYFKLIIL